MQLEDTLVQLLIYCRQATVQAKVVRPSRRPEFRLLKLALERPSGDRNAAVYMPALAHEVPGIDISSGTRYSTLTRWDRFSGSDRGRLPGGEFLQRIGVRFARQENRKLILQENNPQQAVSGKHKP
ncbi:MULTISPECIES: hypothetical protein [unclassified Mesorhizobium]|uniref:hypothetical protein n=1 Tax=unclassified Mesorhizobium TaxID=325217 RepID=UPI0026C24401